MHYLNLPSSNVDLLALHQRNPQRYPYLLESVANGGVLARYNILFAFPQHTLVLRNHELRYQDQLMSDRSFLVALDQLWREEKSAVHSPKIDKLPFQGGWFLYLGYELAAEVEPSLHLPEAQDGLPTAFATRVPAAIIEDKHNKQTYLVSEDKTLLARMEQDYLHAIDSSAIDSTGISIQLQEEEASRHYQVVEQAKQYILDGDIFQANLSRLWRGELESKLCASALYNSLRLHNPSPFAGLLEFEGVAVISSSPERLVEVRGKQVQTRPIAGTRPRHSNEEDKCVTEELLRHPKERAEHIMLIDLERNDLGRISVPGSVQVDELMVLETYSHVHHIVSNVKGELRDGVTPGEVIAAVFPGGTITGCPKVRCMQIIAELETEGRGAYTGSMGYLNHNGDMDLNILIRTLVKKDESIRLRAGGGIVIDSDPESELKETRAKARGLLRALGIEL
ncbi:MAG: aminodeoxychorismate synthase component I [Gammaproteobacteria bacterium]|nr:aminodeoxychorismate synthase component I [Gammaproteobacteria bacterium]